VLLDTDGNGEHPQNEQGGDDCGDRFGVTKLVMLFKNTEQVATASYAEEG
jgi:hypothetical protein